ncbi:MAG: hypothetical protein GX666_13765, partial [Tissierellia bacterium]|nr:hypothetical protein [Tissierellia bacterium]
MNNGISKRLFMGWEFSLLGFFLMAFIYAPATTLSSLFVPPLMIEFNVGITRVVMVTSVGIVAGVLGAIISSRFFEKY